MKLLHAALSLALRHCSYASVRIPARPLLAINTEIVLPNDVALM